MAKWAPIVLLCSSIACAADNVSTIGDVSAGSSVTIVIKQGGSFTPICVVPIAQIPYGLMHGIDAPLGRGRIMQMVDVEQAANVCRKAMLEQ